MFLRALSDKAFKLCDVYLQLGEIMKLMENPGCKVTAKEKKSVKSIVDDLLGRFEGAIDKDTRSTELLRAMRESGYGKYLNCRDSQQG